MGKANAARGRSPQPPIDQLSVEKQPRKPSKSPSKSKSKSKSGKNSSYKSDGVEDNDVFLLPVSDYGIMFALTVLATIVRVYRIYRPSSVVFDEVQ